MKNYIKDLENKHQIFHTALGILAKEAGKEPSEYVRKAMLEHCCHNCGKFLDKKDYTIKKNQYCRNCYENILNKTV